MANTTKFNGRIIEITGLDEDWYVENDLPQFAGVGLKVKSIQFNPSAANDVMKILDTRGKKAMTPPDTAAVEVFLVQCSAVTDQRIKYFGDKGSWMSPYIDISECTLNTAANAKVIIEIA